MWTNINPVPVKMMPLVTFASPTFALWMFCSFWCKNSFLLLKTKCMGEKKTPVNTSLSYKILVNFLRHIFQKGRLIAMPYWEKTDTRPSYKGKPIRHIFRIYTQRNYFNFCSACRASNGPIQIYSNFKRPIDAYTSIEIKSYSYADFFSQKRCRMHRKGMFFFFVL